MSENVTQPGASSGRASSSTIPSAATAPTFVSDNSSLARSTRELGAAAGRGAARGSPCASSRSGCAPSRSSRKTSWANASSGAASSPPSPSATTRAVEVDEARRRRHAARAPRRGPPHAAGREARARRAAVRARDAVVGGLRVAVVVDGARAPRVRERLVQLPRDRPGAAAERRLDRVAQPLVLEPLATRGASSRRPRSARRRPPARAARCSTTRRDARRPGSCGRRASGAPRAISASSARAVRHPLDAELAVQPRRARVVVLVVRRAGPGAPTARARRRSPSGEVGSHARLGSSSRTTSAQRGEHGRRVVAVELVAAAPDRERRMVRAAAARSRARRPPSARRTPGRPTGTLSIPELDWLNSCHTSRPSRSQCS